MDDDKWIGTSFWIAFWPVTVSFAIWGFVSVNPQFLEGNFIPKPDPDGRLGYPSLIVVSPMMGLFGGVAGVVVTFISRCVYSYFCMVRRVFRGNRTQVTHYNSSGRRGSRAGRVLRVMFKAFLVASATGIGTRFGEAIGGIIVFVVASVLGELILPGGYAGEPGGSTHA